MTIARIWKGLVREADASAYLDYVRETGIRDYRATEGNRGAFLLKRETVASMTANGLSDPVLQGKGGNIGWGLANVDVVVGPGSRGYLTAIGEYGWDGSAGTFFAVDPSKELVVTLMTQNLPANPDGLRQKWKAAVVNSIVQ